MRAPRAEPAARRSHEPRACISRRERRDAAVYRARGAAPGRPDRRPGDHRSSANATTVVEPGWQRDGDAARPPGARARRAAARRAARSARSADPVMLEVFNNLFMTIAEQMGVHAAEHRLLGQHQGAARLLLRAVRRRRQPDRQRAAHAGAPRLDGRERAHDPASCAATRMRPGDVYVLNDPYNGGTHLPDVTVIMPVFDERRRSILFYVALARPPRRHRRHHAGLDAARLARDRRGGRADRQLPAGRRGPLPRGGAARAARVAAAIRRATRRRTSPTCRRRSPPAQKGAQRAARRWSTQFGLRRRCAPTCGHVQDNAEESVRRVHRRAARTARSSYAHRQRRA